MALEYASGELRDYVSITTKYREIFCIVTDLSTSLFISGAANNTVVKVGDGSVVGLVCHADGYPTPTYLWLDLNSNQATSGRIYTISTDGKYSLQCTASNYVTYANGSIIPLSVSARYCIIVESGTCTSASGKLTHSQCMYRTRQVSVV